MTIWTLLSSFLIIFAMFVFIYVVYALADWCRKRSSEFKKYKIDSLNYRFTIKNQSQEQVFQKIMNWIISINPREIETSSLESIHVFHVNEWDSDEGRFYGWQKYIDIKIQPVDGRVNVFISMTPTADYQVHPMGENVIIGWEKMAKKLFEEFDYLDRVTSIQDLNDGQYLRIMLDDYKRAYINSLILLLIFIIMIFLPLFVERGLMAATILGIGLIGFIVDLVKFASEYENYWDIHRKIKEEFGI